MKLEIDDPHLGRREIDLNSNLALIKDQLKLLRYFRDDGRPPSRHLEDDIAVYEYIPETDYFVELGEL